MGAALYAGKAGGGGAGDRGSTAKLCHSQWKFRRLEAGKSGSTGVLRKPAREGNCCISRRQKQEISSYFPGLIAVIQNKFLFKGSRRSCGSPGLERFSPRTTTSSGADIARRLARRHRNSSSCVAPPRHPTAHVLV